MRVPLSFSLAIWLVLISFVAAQDVDIKLLIATNLQGEFTSKFISQIPQLKALRDREEIDVKLILNCVDGDEQHVKVESLLQKYGCKDSVFSITKNQWTREQFWKNMLGPKVTAWADFVWLVDSDMVPDPRLFPTPTFLRMARTMKFYIVQPSVVGGHPSAAIKGGGWHGQKFASAVQVVERQAALFQVGIWQRIHRDLIFPVSDEELQLSDSGIDVEWCHVARAIAKEKGHSVDRACAVVRSLSIVHREGAKGYSPAQKNPSKWTHPYQGTNVLFHKKDFPVTDLTAAAL